MKKTIRILTLAMALCLLLSGLSLPALAANKKVTLDVTYRDLKIVIDGVTITPKDVNGAFVEPFLYQGTTYLPVRAVAEALDKEVYWVGDEGAVCIYTKAGAPAAPTPGDGTKGTNARKSVSVTYRDITIVIDALEITPRDAAGAVVEPFIISGTTYLPIRAVAEALGKEVSWDGDTGTVSISDPARTDVTVKTAAEFVAAIGPNRNILLEPGVYNLSAAALRNIQNKYVTWDEVYDGWQLNVLNVMNMTIRGVGDKPAELIVDPRYAFVINFVDSRNLVIENITAGHSEGGYCQGGVFELQGCAGITIDKTNMYGCGTTGLYLYFVYGMTVRNSTIYECTYEIMTMDLCANVLFENCLFRDNKEFSLINLYAVDTVTFDKCEFRNNTAGDDYAFFSGYGPDVVVKNSKFIDNKVETLADIDMTFEDCTFTGNKFEAP